MPTSACCQKGGCRPPDRPLSRGGCGRTAEAKPEAAIDATGLESRHVWAYFVDRRGDKRFRRRRWPKLTLVCHTSTHLWAAVVVTQGPSQDSPRLPEALTQACQRLPIHRLLGDAGYDGDHNQTLARRELGIRTTAIALNRRGTGRRWPQTRYRRLMKRRFPKRKYRQRWQIESAISRHKRRLGAALRTRGIPAQERECWLRVLTHNLMILAAP
jgi:hypothetical protein